MRKPDFPSLRMGVRLMRGSDPMGLTHRESSSTQQSRAEESLARSCYAVADLQRRIARLANPHSQENDEVRQWPVAGTTDRREQGVRPRRSGRGREAVGSFVQMRRNALVRGEDVRLPRFERRAGAYSAARSGIRLAGKTLLFAASTLPRDKDRRPPSFGKAVAASDLDESDLPIGRMCLGVPTRAYKPPDNRRLFPRINPHRIVGARTR